MVFLWAWDEALQDRLSVYKFGTASAYELGRGLSESYWALNEDSDDSHAQWKILFGRDRVNALCDLSRRLAPVFSEYTAPAVLASVTRWGEVAQASDTYDDPTGFLAQQALIWRGLLVTGRDPLTLVPAEKLEAAARDPRPIIKAFRWELLAVLVLATDLALSLTYFSSEARSAFAALAEVGISGRRHRELDQVAGPISGKPDRLRSRPVGRGRGRDARTALAGPDRVAAPDSSAARPVPLDERIRQAAAGLPPKSS